MSNAAQTWLQTYTTEGESSGTWEARDEVDTAAAVTALEQVEEEAYNWDAYERWGLADKRRLVTELGKHDLRAAYEEAVPLVVEVDDLQTELG